MSQPQTQVFEPESAGASQPRIRVPYELPDALSGFPSEADAPAPETIFDEHMISPLVEPSEADRQRLFPPPQPRRLPVRRLSKGAGMVLVVLAGGFSVASIVLLGLIPASSPAKSDTSLSTVNSRPADIVPPTTREAATPFVPAPAASVEPTPTPLPPRTPPRRDVAVERNTKPVSQPNSSRTAAAPPRETPAPASDLASVPNWSAASALTRPALSPPVTRPDASAGTTNIAPPATPSPAVPSPTATPPAPVSVANPPPTATPAASTTEASARAARTAAVQSVLDRYRDAFDALDANAVGGFWPSADVRALSRAFAQLETQRFQFDRCDIQLAGARAIASCNGYAESVRKAGSRDGRAEPRQWTFTLAEDKDRWVILSVDARSVR